MKSISKLLCTSPNQDLLTGHEEDSNTSRKSVKNVNLLPGKAKSIRGFFSNKKAAKNPIDELQLSTRNFLKNNSLTTGYLEQDLPIYFNSVMENKYQISTTPNPGGTQIEAFYLPVVREDTININDHIGVDLGKTEGNLLVTPLLTGCSMAIKKHQGKTHISHFQPFSEKGENFDAQAHKTLNSRLIQSGYKVYGPNDYDGKMSTFIGVRNGGNWSFFAQEKDGTNLKVKKLW
ncbi:hypothetical protein [Vibrio sp. AND4]|uniref:hypothetical protein n=1 Tax=Vibrio sp. AND4 TaxID=314289 RepID=UPI00015F2C05|nr:hypothetical protein [Vibrio sp. AND4]EDP57986.1 hypothetical protein AND4_05429 [Vibrio sp. AND4]